MKATLPAYSEAIGEIFIRDLLAQAPTYVMQPRDVLTTEARMPTNSEAIGVIFISQKCSYPELCVVKNKNKKKKEKYVGLGTSMENSFVLYNHAVM